MAITVEKENVGEKTTTPLRFFDADSREAQKLGSYKSIF